MASAAQKARGAYYTPDEVAATLVGWAVRQPSDHLLDPSCGDGRFLALHGRSSGVEQDQASAAEARLAAPDATIHVGDFFSWADGNSQRFDCAAGNPPFIRYQRFSGAVRTKALAVCEALGARFTALTSSWAPFLTATASLLKPGGRLAFVVPAEVGHAPYATPLLEYLVAHFETVHLVAIRERLFPDLSEDCWLLYAAGHGGSTTTIRLTAMDRLRALTDVPEADVEVPVAAWRHWHHRLRPFLLPSPVREAYQAASRSPGTVRLGLVARVKVGYVTGDNEFFHLRPSVAAAAGIPGEYLLPAVRTGAWLPRGAVDDATVQAWLDRDEPVLLLRLRRGDELPEAVLRYLDSERGQRARTTFKCRTRRPWYAVPDVAIPDVFLSYMSGRTPALAANEAGCGCANGLHGVTLVGGLSRDELVARWAHPLVQLSCELEGHPLGGGMLKLEPREAARVLLPQPDALDPATTALFESGTQLMRRWRHYA